MAKRYYNPGMYEGPEERARQEREDRSMLNSDYSAIANMPQMPVMKMYPKADYAVQPDLDDRLSGVDHQMKSDEKENKKGRYPEKY